MANQEADRYGGDFLDTLPPVSQEDLLRLVSERLNKSPGQILVNQAGTVLMIMAYPQRPVRIDALDDVNFRELGHDALVDHIYSRITGTDIEWPENAPVIRCASARPCCHNHIVDNKFARIRAGEAGWFFSRRTGKAFCPEHVPEWVKPWRGKKQDEHGNRTRGTGA
jgi:hypothetical protein